MSVAQRFGGKEATEYKPQTWTGEKGSVHSIQDGMAELGRITARQHDESHGCRRSKRQTDGVGLDTRNAGMSQETVDDFEEMDRKLSQVPISCTKREAKHHLRIPERSGFMAWKQMVSHFDPRTGAGQVCCIRFSDTLGESERTGIIKTQDAVECQKHHADVGTRSGRI